MARFVFIEWILDWIDQQRRFYFEWDEGNSDKNFLKHQVTCREAESVFQNIGLIRILGEQIAPVATESRFGLFGMTLTGRSLFVCFTIRNGKIRIISARALNRKEQTVYANLCKE